MGGCFSGSKPKEKSIIDDKEQSSNILTNTDTEISGTFCNNNMENICQITSSNGLIGIGFFSKIALDQSNNKLPALITSNKILKNDDLIPGKNIALFFKKSNKSIMINIDNKRKCFSSLKYQISIIEIKNEDNLDFLIYFDIGTFQNQNDINLVYFNNMNNQQQYCPGKILNYNDNLFLFNIDNSLNLDEAIGCPILTNDNRKVIGLNMGNTNNSYNGLFISKAIKSNSFLKFRTKIIFYDMDYNKYYEVNTRKTRMFGELITCFYIVSNLDFDENISFYFNNQEIPCYSTNTLIELNIQNNHTIFFKRINKIILNNMLNILFEINGVKKILVICEANMLFLELILKFCQINKYHYTDINNKCVLLYNAIDIKNSKLTLAQLGFLNHSLIQLVEQK